MCYVSLKKVSYYETFDMIGSDYLSQLCIVTDSLAIQHWLSQPGYQTTLLCCLDFCELLAVELFTFEDIVSAWVNIPSMIGVDKTQGQISLFNVLICIN